MTRAEVLAGEGTVIRFGQLVLWAGPTASAALVSFLLQSARNVGPAADSGRQVADHVAAILGSRDPEPASPFGAVGPDGQGGWACILHGPVQVWDGTKWLAPTPSPGWIRGSVTPTPAVSIGPAGSPSPRLVVDSPYDLEAGMVPGGGVIVVPGGAPTQPGQQRADPPVAAGGTTPGGAGATFSSRGSWTGPATVTAPPPAPEPHLSAEALGGPVGAVGSAGGPFGAPDPLTEDGPHVGGGPSSAGPGPGPEVEGVVCPAGHLNRPGTDRCAECRAPIGADAPVRRGPRPSLGVLVADDGTTYPLTGDLLFGADPAADAGRSGGLQPVMLTAAPGALAPAHSEIRLQGWQVQVVDRGAASGSYVAVGESGSWERLVPFEPRTLEEGSHVSFGGRVLTLLRSWDPSPT